MASVISKVVDTKSRSENMPAPLVKKHSKVIITLENVLLSEEKICGSPSLQDCLDPETELDLRILGCELIQTSGILLKLPQVAMATGQVLFQRFYYAKSLVRYPMETTAMACIALASKIEESPMKIRDVINVFKHINQVKNGKAIQPVLLDSNYISLKNQVVKAERRLLKELGFCCHVKHPHKIIIMYLRLLEAEQKKLAQSSWNYMNDALRTNVFVRFTPETIACACIWLSGRQLKICLPENPPWYNIFRVTLSDIEEIAASILKLYTRKKVKLEVLEAKVEEIRKEQQDARLRNKVVSAMVTPNQINDFSPASRNNTPSKRIHSSQGRKRSSSPDRRGDKRSGSSRDRSSHSRSHSPNRHNRKKVKHSHSLSQSPRSHSRSRSHSRDRYHGKKKYSRTPSPAVTPPPRFIKNKEKGPIVRSLSRSRSRSPHRSYDKYDRGSDKYLEKPKSIDKYVSKYEKIERYSKVDYYDYNKRYVNNKVKSEKYLKYQEKLERKLQKESKREAKKSYSNGYEKVHKSKKNGRQRVERSRSRDRDSRR